MAVKKNSEMSLEELKAKENTLKKIVPMFAVLIALLAAAGIFLTWIQGFGVFTILPIVFLTILVANIANLKSVRKEISDRT